MALKIFLPLMITAFFTLNVSANETKQNNTLDDCETVYTLCEERCISDENVNKGSCLEKCDEAYEKCVDQSPAQ